jgi:hypothetical protein
MTLSVAILYNVEWQDSRMLIGKDLQRSGRWLIGIVYRHFCGGAEENHENVGQNSWCPGRDSNRAPTEYRTGCKESTRAGTDTPLPGIKTRLSDRPAGNILSRI